MIRKVVDTTVIIPDASPVLTLARIGRIDLLGRFTVPIKIVDQVFCEITKTQNDPKGEVGVALKKALELIEKINATRKTPLVPFEKLQRHALQRTHTPLNPLKIQ
jgi:predicted nucleic acid-binding protein